MRIFLARLYAQESQQSRLTNFVRSSKYHQISLNVNSLCYYLVNLIRGMLIKYAVLGKTNKLLGSEELALIAHVPLLQKCASWPEKRSAKINWLY